MDDLNTKVLFSSKEEKWATPQDFFDKLNDEFHFTLDVAASPNNAKCTNYFTEEQRKAILSDRMPSEEIVKILNQKGIDKQYSECYNKDR